MVVSHHEGCIFCPGLHLCVCVCELQLELAVKTQQADFVDVRVADALKQVSDLELLQVGRNRGQG